MLRFEKIPYKQFCEDMTKVYGNLTEEFLKNTYDSIKLPRRATGWSAGYDFYAIMDETIYPESKAFVIPTGIKFCTDDPTDVLLIFPRSGLGFKYGAYLENTVGVIDADYQFAKNYGHIMIKMGCRNGSVHIEPGMAFCQGIITSFKKTDDDNPVSWDREGGFGSTTEKTKNA